MTLGSRRTIVLQYIPPLEYSLLIGNCPNSRVDSHPPAHKENTCVDRHLGGPMTTGMSASAGTLTISKVQRH